MKPKSLNIPFVEARYFGSGQRPNAIVIDLSMTTSDEGAALAIAKNLHRLGSPESSYHYVVDEAKEYQCVMDRLEASSVPRRSLGILMCAKPHEQSPLWMDGAAALVLTRTARLVANLAAIYKIPLRYVEGHRLSRWRGGIVVRAPGTWPHESFLEDVHAFSNNLN